MKYIKKILIILFLVIMISGCKVEYNLKINKDLSLNEKVTASENTDRMKSRTNLDVNQSVKYLYKIYKPDFMKDGQYTITSSGNSTSATVNNTYDSLKDYSTKFSNDIFEFVYDDEDKSKTMMSYSQYALINTKATNRYIYDQIDITIEVPFEVIESNADSVRGNKYTWTVRADSDEYKHIVLKFNGERPKNTVSFSFFGKKSHIGYEYIILIVLIIAILVAAIVLYTKNKKNNKM